MKKINFIIFAWIFLFFSMPLVSADAFVTIGMKGLGFVAPQVSAAVNAAVCLSAGPIICAKQIVEGKIIGIVMGEAYNTALKAVSQTLGAETAKAVAEGFSTYNEVKGWVDDGAQILEELKQNEKGVIESGKIQSADKSKEISLQNVKYDRDEKTKLITYTFDEKGQIDIKTKDGKINSFKNIKKNGWIKTDENGNVKEATLETSAQTTYVFGENQPLTVPENTKIIYKDGVVTVHGKVDKYDGFEVGNDADSISFFKDKIEGKSFTIYSSLENFRDIVKITAKGSTTFAEITKDGFIIDKGTIIAFESKTVEIESTESMLLAYADADISQYKVAVRVFENGIEAKSEKGKIDIKILEKNELFRTYKGQNVAFSISNGDSIKVIKEKGEVPTLSHFSSENGFTEVENGKIKIKLDKKGYYLYPKMMDKAAVALNIESDSVKFDEKMLEDDNIFKIQKKDDVLTFFGLKRSGTLLRIAQPSENDIVSFKNQYSNVKFEDINSWSVDELTTFKKMFGEISTESPTLFKSVKSFELSEMFGAAGAADREGRVILNPRYSDSETTKYVIIHELGHTTHFNIDSQLKNYAVEIDKTLASLYTTGASPIRFDKEIKDLFEKINNGKNCGDFTRKWADIAGNLYQKDCIKVEMPSRIPRCGDFWTDRTSGPKNGFIRPYGATNLLEDVATMVEESYESPQKVIDAAKNDARIRDKIKLLCKEKLVEKDEVCKNV